MPQQIAASASHPPPPSNPTLKPILRENTTRWKGRDIAMIGAGVVIGIIIGAIAGAAIGSFFNPMGIILGAVFGGGLGSTLIKRQVSFSEEPIILIPHQDRLEPKYDKKEDKEEELALNVNSEFSQEASLLRFTQQEILDLLTKKFNTKIKYYESQGLKGDLPKDRGNAQLSDESKWIFEDIERCYPNPEEAREQAEEMIGEKAKELTGAMFQEAICAARKVHTNGQRATNLSGDKTRRRLLTPEHVANAWNCIQQLAKAPRNMEALPGEEDFHSTYKKLKGAFKRVDKLPSNFRNTPARLVYEVGSLLFDEKNEEAARLKAIEFVESQNS